MKRLSPLLLLLVALAAPAPAHAARDIYVSLGDSWAVGYAPNPQTGAPGKTSATNSYVNQLATLARKKGYGRLKVVNFGCGGATTVSLLNNKKKCRGLAPGAPDYEGMTQMTAGERYVAKNRDRIALITVIIGGNDVTACAKEADPVPCVGGAAAALQRNVTKIAQRLRRAAGPRVQIIGGTYANVVLGEWVRGGKPSQDLAGLSNIAFKSIINPTLEKAYAAGKARFADVTTATGAYTPLDQMTDFPPYGQVPVAVAHVCEISYYCKFRDIHLTRAGYREVAEAFYAELPRRSR